MAVWLIAVIATTILFMIVLVRCFCPEELAKVPSGRTKGMRRFRRNKCDSYHGDAEGEPMEIGNDDHWNPPCEEKGEDCGGDAGCDSGGGCDFGAGGCEE